MVEIQSNVSIDCQRKHDILHGVKPFWAYEGLIHSIDYEKVDGAFRTTCGLVRSGPGRPRTGDTAITCLRCLSNPNASIKFHKVESAQFKKTKQELQAYESDITKILSENSVKDG